MTLYNEAVPTYICTYIDTKNKDYNTSIMGLTRGYHDFMFFCSNSQKCKVVLNQIE